MIQMQKFYTDISQSTTNQKASYRRLKRIQEAKLDEVLIIRSQFYWEQWPAE